MSRFTLVVGRRPLLPLLILGLVAAGVADGSDRVYPTPEAVQPLEPGSAVPSALVRSVAGDVVDLAVEVREAGALLVFYRGGW